MPDLDLLSRARDRHVAVIGGGLAGLLAAWHCARVGIAVTLIEARDHLGGVAAPVDLDGLLVPRTAVVHDPALFELLAPLPLAPHSTALSPARIATARGVVPEPADSLLGIPSNPWAEDVRRVIGGRGTWRAYLDRLRPPLTIGREASLGALVRGRMGTAVAERLVAPLAGGRYECPIDALDADAVAPGISAALTRAGSLAGAVAERETDAPRAAELPVLDLSALVVSLEGALRDLDATVHLDTRAHGLTRAGDHWQIAADAAEDAEDAEIAPADAVLIATGPVEARDLLADLITDPALDEEVPTVVEHTLLVADARPADPSTVVFDADCGIFQARVAPAAGRPGYLVLSVATDPAAPASALQRATVALLGDEAPDPSAATSLSRVAVGVGRRIGDPARTAAVRAALHARPGLYAVGAWIGGGEVGEALVDAGDEAERARRALLFGDDEPHDTGAPGSGAGIG